LAAEKPATARPPSAAAAGIAFDSLADNYYTGFTIIAGSGTYTGGTIRVYGYRN